MSGEWRFGDLDTPDYSEGEAIPFLLRIEDAEPGTTYILGISYDCASDGVAAYDFVVSYDRDVGTEPALAKEGPGRTTPDATLVIPDDPSIEFDDEDQGELERLFQLWGGTFASEPIGPVPDLTCGFDKLMMLDITAHAETLFLLWGGHLACAGDWGEGLGASSQSSRFEMRAHLAGVDGGDQRVGTDPSAIFGEYFDC